jgi:glycerol-3-phosphate O-acyltransferase
MNWLVRPLLAWWVRYKVVPDDVVESLQGRRRQPLCYVLERRSIMDLGVLQNACARLRLARPGQALLPGSDLRSFIFLSYPRSFWDQRPQPTPPPQLKEMIEALRADPDLDIDLVPVTVYWGRAPKKEETSWLRLMLRLMLVESWALVTRLSKLMRVIINGRDTFVELDEPISLRSLLGDQVGGAVRGRRITQSLRAMYATRRAARIGPDLSHRRTVVSRVLRTRAVRQAAAQLVREKKISRRQALQQAQRNAEEIAANYSHALVVFLEHAMKRLWNRLYDGVDFAHVETLEAAMRSGHEIIYVPCHRSHMDYLLLSYVIYVHGYAIPHIAAGINLNIPVVGRFLRMGGAFFIRRSFRGSALYTVVFMKYLAIIMARGHSLEYFIEGGRSRTGRLLQPKTGMLAMTLRSFLREPVRPVVFVPVYFGYERIVEGRTYIGELSGKPKKKESILGLARSLPKLLRQRFGRVHVNLGEPIELGELLDRYDPGWREQPVDEDARVPWVGKAVDELAGQIMRSINAAAAVNPINLLAITLLATPRQALPEPDLVRQLDLYRAILRDFPYSERVTHTTLTGRQIIAYAESMRVISREQHVMGDIVSMSDESAVLAAYFRNNILHLFAMPSLVACVFVNNAQVTTEDIRRLAWRIYPYIAAELFLRWRDDELPSVIDRVLISLEHHGLIKGGEGGTVWHRPDPSSSEAMQLSLLARATIQTIERYYLTVHLLVKAGSGNITQSMLEQRCQLTAQRMTMLYGFNSPEFFDRTLFENFIDLLRARQVLRNDASGKLEFESDVLLRAVSDAQLVLSEQIRHGILQLAHT